MTNRDKSILCISLPTEIALVLAIFFAILFFSPSASAWPNDPLSGWFGQSTKKVTHIKLDQSQRGRVCALAQSSSLIALSAAYHLIDSRHFSDANKVMLSAFSEFADPLNFKPFPRLPTSLTHMFSNWILENAAEIKMRHEISKTKIDDETLSKILQSSLWIITQVTCGIDKDVSQHTENRKSKLLMLKKDSFKKLAKIPYIYAAIDTDTPNRLVGINELANSLPTQEPLNKSQSIILRTLSDRMDRLVFNMESIDVFNSQLPYQCDLYQADNDSPPQQQLYGWGEHIDSCMDLDQSISQLPN